MWSLCSRSPSSSLVSSVGRALPSESHSPGHANQAQSGGRRADKEELLRPVGRRWGIESGMGSPWGQGSRGYKGV